VPDLDDIAEDFSAALDEVRAAAGVRVAGGASRRVGVNGRRAPART
jgi:hypothetical protein